VIAVASSEEKRRRIADLYAPEHVLAGPVGFREAVLEITGGRGADLVYDPVGGDAFDDRRAALRSAAACWWSGSPVAGFRTSVPTFR
jgi:NADPH2:quinone reductase